jgi:hypothetical protein
MSVSQRISLIVAATALLCPRAYAPIYGTYPGLHSLIKEADVIAAITILDKLSEDDMGGSARYKIEFEKIFKGKAPNKQSVAYLRYLDIIPTPPVNHYYGFVERFQPFVPSSRWIAFLTKGRPDVEAAYENVNCSGSTFPLSPRRDLEALKVDSLPDTLTLLFREYVDYKRGEVKEWEKQLDAFVHERDQ